MLCLRASMDAMSVCVCVCVFVWASMAASAGNWLVLLPVVEMMMRMMIPRAVSWGLRDNHGRE